MKTNTNQRQATDPLILLSMSFGVASVFLLVFHFGSRYEARISATNKYIASEAIVLGTTDNRCNQVFQSEKNIWLKSVPVNNNLNSDPCNESQPPSYSLYDRQHNKHLWITGAVNHDWLIARDFVSEDFSW